MSESVMHTDVSAASPDRVRPAVTALRIALIVDGVAFATAAVLNFGAQIPLGVVTLSFPVPVVQASVGESIIGIALLLAGVSQLRGLAWLAFWLSVAGTAFGVVATTVGSGPAWSIHLVFGSLALVVLGLLVWTGRSDVRKQDAYPAHGRQTERQLSIGLMLVTAVTLLAASIIHFGLTLPLGGFGVSVSDQFLAAAAPEAVLGILLALGAAYLASGRTGSREMALASTVFTLLLSLYGLSLTLPMARTGDVVYHIALVVLLGAIIGGLVRSMTRPSSGRTAFTASP